MKPHLLFFCCLLLYSCHSDSPVKKKNINPYSSTTISDEDRISQIANAENNRALIPGRWRIFKEKFNGQELTIAELREKTFDTYDFSSPSNYAFYKGKRLISKGTYEWMANDREIVFTPDNDSTISRLLIWNTDGNFMKASVKSSYMILKKMRLKVKEKSVGKSR